MGGIIFVILAVLCAAGHAFLSELKIRWLRRGLRTILTIGVLNVFAVPLYIEGGEGLKPAIKFDEAGQVVEISRWMVFCTDNCTNSITEVNVQSHVSPITDNPKVRRITYQIKVKVTDWQKFFDTIGYKEPWEGYTKNTKAMAERVRFLLYEFNNAHSKELAAFYNPLDRNQQRALESLLQDDLNPEMLARNGLKMTELESFSVDE